MGQKMPVSTETQLPNLSSTLVERLARREMERGEGRSGLKTRLRRWVGTSTSRRRPRESRPMEEREHHIEQEVTEQLKLSIEGDCPDVLIIRPATPKDCDRP